MRTHSLAERQIRKLIKDYEVCVYQRQRDPAGIAPALFALQQIDQIDR